MKEQNNIDIKLGGTSQQTAIKAADYLISLNIGFHIPNKKHRRNLLIAYAEQGLTLYGKAFDIVKSKNNINYDSIDDIRNNFDSIIIYEIKSTAKRTVKENFKGHFFSISTAELLTAQNIKGKYKFAFVNTITKTWEELTLEDILKKSKGIYPTWSIQF